MKDFKKYDKKCEENKLLLSSKSLNSFIEELQEYAKNVSILYWDDTVIMINKNQSCMRYY